MNNQNDRLQMLEEQAIQRERRIRYIEDIKGTIQRDIEKAMIENQLKTTERTPLLLRKNQESLFNEQSATVYIQFLMVPRSVVMDNQQLLMMITIQSNALQLEILNDKEPIIIPVRLMSYIQLERHNGISLTARNQSPLHVQFANQRKQTKYFEALSFIIENKNQISLY